MTEVEQSHNLTPIKDSEKIVWKEGFIERYSKLTDFEEFRKYSLSYLRRSIRINTLKTNIEDIKKRLEKDWILTPIPWCKEGFWLDTKTGRYDIGNTIEHYLGYIYVQEAASMIPPLALDPKEGERVLDMCAAPGSKTTQMAAMMKNKGMIVANEQSYSRIQALSFNIERCGAANVIISEMYGQAVKGTEFDKILLDAPCSGTGTIRKSLKTIGWWNPNYIKSLCKTQRRLLDTAWSLLKKGGVLVYSTCSLEPEENEEMISEFLEKHNDAKIEKIDLDIRHGDPVMEFEGKEYDAEIRKCLRLWPQDNDTEGFFIAKLKKK